MSELKIETLLGRVSSYHDILARFEVFHFVPPTLLVQIAVDLCDIVFGENIELDLERLADDIGEPMARYDPDK